MAISSCLAPDHHLHKLLPDKVRRREGQVEVLERGAEKLRRLTVEEALHGQAVHLRHLGEASASSSSSWTGSDPSMSVDGLRQLPGVVLVPSLAGQAEEEKVGFRQLRAEPVAAVAEDCQLCLKLAKGQPGGRGGGHSVAALGEVGAQLEEVLRPEEKPPVVEFVHGGPARLQVVHLGEEFAGEGEDAPEEAVPAVHGRPGG
ncbi:hypothetical protein TYRP_011861 [Tyrophagus putrescentiae]|nr:hypothetical protein TYRP_011861 [Tyrophagus putrescentiae]